MRTALFLVLVVAVAASCKEKVNKSKPADKVAVDKKEPAHLAATDYRELDSSKCSACHKTIVEEWRTSMHGNSTLDKDPLFRLMFAKAKAKKGDKVETVCRKCHNPMWKAGSGEQLASAEGITCVVCHEIAGNHPGPLADGRFARLDATRTASGVEGLCLSCHAERKTGAGVPICTTGPENEAAGRASCIGCHMGKSPGPATIGSEDKEHRSHRFPGGHNPEFVAGSAELLVKVEAAEVVATIKVKEIGHSLPTGNPMRHLVVELVATDADGKVLWTNRPEGTPFLEPREAFAMRVFSSADGKRPVPPFMSKGEPDDNRIASGAARELRYPLPTKAEKLSGRLLYYLAPANVLEAASVPASWSQAVVVAQTEIVVK
jgi:hypothetical protein